MENDPEPSDKSLVERVAQLEALVQAQADELKKYHRWMNDGDDLIIRYVKLLQRGQADAFERLKNIELKIFPNLAADVMQVINIIGENDEVEDPLDRRKS